MRRLLGVIGCLAVAGCSTGPAPGPKQAPVATATSAPASAAPSVTLQEAASVLEDYVKRNNAANKAKSAKLLAEYEGGSSFAIDKAGYASSGKGDEYLPFSYTKPAYTVPAAKEGRWFLITAKGKIGSHVAMVPTYLLFAHNGMSWRQLYAPNVFNDQPADELPELAASGPAAAVAQSDATGLLMSPTAFAKSYAAHLAGKGTGSRFAPDGLTATARSNRIKMKQWAKLTETVRPATTYPSYALRTADGGALAFTTVERNRRYDVHQGPEHNYVFQEQGPLKGRKFYTFMKSTELIQVVAHIPPKTDDPGRVKVIGSHSGVISGSGR